MRPTLWRNLGAAVTLAATTALAAAPVNPQVFKTMFDEKSKNAEVVAQVRVASATCTAAEGEAPAKTVTLQLALQVQDVEKGSVKKGEVITVTHKVTLPAGPGPRAYGYMAAQRQFPFQPGVKGSVALNWDKEKRVYVVVAGWVPEPNGTQIPTEVGKKIEAADVEKPK
jgi:hypothetical protein